MARKAGRTGKNMTSDGTDDEKAWVDETAEWCALDGCCGTPPSDGTEDDLLSIELPGFVGMFRGGKADLARRAKDIVRGTTASSDGTVCKCPSGEHIYRGAQ